ncbi:MAG TPA: hypothetical protein PLD55_06130 [bacterium]|nr:hypothetical protein [bacterium]MDX9805195.1 hypothetical protein [bacterium]HNZ53854.1 hypothetical protein [bacterium]HOG43978.1 hypothetical protein [bacterium]HPA55905.1 hypothetical protein [bacterium]
MKNLSFKFVTLSLLTFLLISFTAYILNFQFIHITVFSLIFTLFYSEKKIRHRITYIVIALLIYSQFATPMPVTFILLVSIQLYFLTVSFFESTAFDFSLTALINSILSVIVININRLIYLYVFTGEFRVISTSANTAVSAVILVLAYNLFKPSIDQLFIKDSWL